MKQTLIHSELKQLIELKYGEEKFDFGCFIVAQWMVFEFRKQSKKWTAEFVKQLAVSENGLAQLINKKELLALRKLFGQQMVYIIRNKNVWN